MSHLIQNPIFQFLRGKESDPTLVLDIGPDGKDRSAGTDYSMTPIGNAVLGLDYVHLNGTTAYLRNAVANFQSTNTTGTIVAWVRRTAAGAPARTIFASVDEAADNDKFTISCASNVLWITSKSSTGTHTQLYTDEQIPATEWTQVIVKSSGTAFSAFLNGQSAALRENTGTNTGQWIGAVPNRDSIIIGADTSNAGVANYFNGDVPNVRYYSEEKSDNWCVADFARGVPDSSLVAAWGPDGKDHSRFGNDMTPQADAIVGSRCTLDGTGDYLLKTIANWRSADTAGTIRAWVRSAAASGTIFATADAASDSNFFMLQRSGGKLSIYNVIGGGGLGVTGDTTMLTNAWYRVGATGNGSEYKLYVNGVPQSLTPTGAGNTGSWFSTVANRDNITIGVLGRSSIYQYWNGDIDTVEVNNRAFSASEMLEDYERTKGCLR